MKKYKIICSDLHLGSGRHFPDGTVNSLEDFIADRQFSEWLEYFRKGDYQDADVELILNGDILNTLEVDYRGYLSPILTEEISVEKLKKVIKGHPLWFKSLSDFASIPHHHITFVVGNHDVDMLWTRCKALFAEAVGQPVEFRNFTYLFDGLHVEHGSQQEIINRIDPKKMFITKGLKEPILNLPWGSHFVVNFVVPLKRERPGVDKVRPLKAFARWGLLNDTWWFIKTFVRAALYFLGTRFSKSIYRTSNLVTTIKLLKELTTGYNLDRQARRLLDDSPDIHTVIFGHTHFSIHKQFQDGKEYLNSGTWNEFVSLELATLGRGTHFNYIMIDYTLSPLRPRCYLREWRGKWHEDLESY